MKETRPIDPRDWSESQIAEFRRSLIASHPRCMVCGASPSHRLHRFPAYNELCVHEVLNGALRQRVLAEPSCLIVACYGCNTGSLNQKGAWPLARQLAVIKMQAPERFDLLKCLAIRNPKALRFVEEYEIQNWIDLDREAGIWYAV